jgi:hypothetical protein
MTALEAAVGAARALLGEEGMKSLRLVLEERVRDEIDDAARKSAGPEAGTWKAAPECVKAVAAQDILSEVA